MQIPDLQLEHLIPQNIQTTYENIDAWIDLVENESDREELEQYSELVSEGVLSLQEFENKVASVSIALPKKQCYQNLTSWIKTVQDTKKQKKIELLASMVSSGTKTEEWFDSNLDRIFNSEK